MELVIYAIIFIIGALFGSFYTLAVYRIPKKQDITHTRSYCPKCNHKLGFLDMFPILSYILLGGKCRYCKEKIRPRYLILEILSGLVFVLLFYLMKIDIYNIQLYKIYEYAFFALFITFIFLTAGIDIENRKIEKSVSVYGIFISIIYIAYLCIIEKASIYRYAIYIFFYILVLILDTITLKKYAKTLYINGLLLTILTMAIFTGEYVTIQTIILTLFSIAIYIIINAFKKLKNKNFKTKKQICKDLNIGYFLCLSNIIMTLFVLAYNNYLM